MGYIITVPVANAAERVSSTTFIHAHTGAGPAADRRIAITDIVTKDASGRVGIGTSSPNERFQVNGTIGSIAASGVNGFVVGDYSSAAGSFSITARSPRSLVFTDDFAGAERLRFNASGHVLPGVTNVQDIGAPGSSWRSGFIQNAFTVTSDASLKQRGTVLSDNEILAGKRIAAELCWWKWLDSIARKGEAARNHFGPMAQDIARILVECGVELDWAAGNPSFRSDMLCWDAWDDITEPVMATRTVQKEITELVEVAGSDDGTGTPFFRKVTHTVDSEESYDTGEVVIKKPAGSEWRIDPSQVAFFVIAAINADTERRLAALEGAA